MNRIEMRMHECESRATIQDDGSVILTGRPVVFNSWTDLGWFDEIIEPGALDETDLRDVRFLVNHDMRGIPLARSRRNNGNSTMLLVPDALGLNMEYARLDVGRNEQARALVSAIERGDISGMSFCFSVDSDKWDDLESDHPKRHILKISSIIEVSCVSFPAYEDTYINIREQSREALDNARAELESLKQARAVETAKAELDLLKAKLNLY